jgi:CRISPR-associated Csx2 family protein
MARKVFISVLGTGFYEKCTYYTDSFSMETRFIQHATLAMLTQQSEWTKDDAAYILLTNKAQTDNWQPEGNKRFNFREGKSVDYDGLKTVLQNSEFALSINPISINDGKDENEMWDIFNSVYSLLQDGDELYFDITHGFRYLPMFVIVLGNYAKFMKNVSVKAVTYGNFEAKNEQGAPIMNLLSLSTLQDWTSSAATFVETGRVKAFGAEMLALREDSALPRRINAYIQEFNRCLNEFEGQISTCRGADIVRGAAVHVTNEYIKRIKDAEVLPLPIVEVLNKIQNTIGQYQENSLNNLHKAIEWCKHYDLVQQGYTLCQESIITFLCSKFPQINPHSKKEAYKDKNYRDFWGSILAVDDGVMNDEAKWGKNLVQNRPLARALFNMQWVKEFRKKYKQLADIRNKVNHAGFIGDSESARAEIIKRRFRSSVDACMKLFDEDLPALVIENPTEEKVFINLSNHPKDQWSAEQLDAAKQFGECVDMPFPQIDPNDDVNQIDASAKEYIQKIMEHAASKTVTVHIMGEMCFTYRMIKQLRALDIRCVCSTSYRLVRDEGNGKRYVEFHFKQFRDYEC